MKKKKTVHMRRIRRKSDNKFKKYSILNFEKIFNSFFLKKTKKQTSSLSSFLLCFIAINIKKIYFMFKIFGLNNKYKVNKNKKIDISIFLFIFRTNFLFFERNTERRRYNVSKKKKLLLHVSYRHLLSLPVRGQRTKTNGKTRKHYGII